MSNFLTWSPPLVATFKVTGKNYIFRKSFSQNSETFGYSFTTNGIIHMFLP